MSDEPIPDSDLLNEEVEEEIDDDFLYHLYQGGELLQAGRMVEAKEQLEKAFMLKPKNARGQNLLGLVYFKLGLFYRAVEIYRGLVERFPEDVTLQVNLGMVYFKAGMLTESESALRHAVQLNSNHEKAHRYLGLVLVRKGEREEARQHFSKAGVKDLERFLDAEPLPVGPAGPPEVSVAAQNDVAEAAAQGFRELEEKEVPFRPVVQATSRTSDAQVVPDGVEGWRANGRGPVGWSGTTMPASSQEVFSVQASTLVVRAQGRLYSRLDSLLWMEGDLKFEGVNKRFGGEVTRHPFDTGTRAIMTVEGEGELGFAPAEREFFVLRHGEEAGYFLEELVFAFSDTSAWENGRLPVSQGNDLAIFHLFGAAQLVLSCRGPVQRRHLDGSSRFLLDTGKLVGWTGNLVPRLITSTTPLPEGLWIELRGAGEVFHLV